MVKMISEALLFIIILIGMVAIILGWLFGIPYVAYMLYDGLSYTTYLSIWFGMLFVRNFYGRMTLEKQLKQIIGVKK